MSTSSRPLDPPLSLDDARAAFVSGRGYLAPCSLGLPARSTLDAIAADAADWGAGRASAPEYCAIVERVRASFATIVNVPVEQVAIGSQTSVIAAVLAAASPAGAEVLCVDGDFSSMVFPFLAQEARGVRVRSVPLEDLAASITADTALVAFSAIQSATGRVADVEAITAAAREHGARTFCDLTQAAGVHPVDASVFDATVTHAYKWLSAPRGVAFLTVTPEYAAELVPVQAGWYAGEAVWDSCYGPDMILASDARRFDVSPAWNAFAGAEPVLALHARMDHAQVWTYASGLGDALCRGLGMEEQHQAIVTWADPDGSALAALTAAGLTASGRAGRVRVGFHLWNDEEDVAAVVAAIGNTAAG